VAAASGAVGAGPSVGYCASLRRELAGEPDAGNLHLRFDEGRVGRAICVVLSPTLPPPVWHKGTTEIAPLLIVRDESHRLSLGGLLSSRARLRFAGYVQFAIKEYSRSRNFQRTANSVLTVLRGLRPAKLHENDSEFSQNRSGAARLAKQWRSRGCLTV
jgi:hypothetical protein